MMNNIFVLGTKVLVAGVVTLNGMTMAVTKGLSSIATNATAAK